MWDLSGSGIKPVFPALAGGFFFFFFFNHWATREVPITSLSNSKWLLVNSVSTDFELVTNLRFSQVIFKSRSHSPLLVFFCRHHPFPEDGIPYSPVSTQPLSRMVLISAAWVTWQPPSRHWRGEHSDWSALVMWGGSQGVGRGILANSPTQNGEKLFSKRGVQASNLYLPQRMNNNTISAHLTLQCSIL